MARAAMPMFSGNCGSTRTIAGPPPSAELARLRSVPDTGSDVADRRPLAEQLVDDAVVQRPVGGVDDVGGDADRRPVLAVGGGLDHHAGDRSRAVAWGENPHLVVD